MRNAFIAGTMIALACGTAGYFIVLRAQIFIGDALSHAALTGALAALAGGIDLRIGLFVVTIGVALAMGLIDREGRADDVTIGIVFVFVLGLGVLFLGMFTSGHSGSNGTAGISVLFGSLLGLSGGDVLVNAITSAIVIAGVIAIARPLLFASIAPEVASARGVPVRALGIVSLGLVGATAAITTQAVGALLLLGLLSAPAAAAVRLSTRPFVALALSAVLSVGIVWAGIGLSVAAPRIPPSFAILALAACVHAGSYLKRSEGVRRATVSS
ncbi:MAG: metal ABC transporter permease [Actinomycetota bacterium]